MKLISAGILGTALVLGIAGCSSQDQEKAKQEAREDARKTSEGARKAGHEAKEEARELSQRVDAVVKPDSQSASDKLSSGADQVKDAASRAGVKLDHAAIVAKVRAKLASDAGLATLTKVDVAVNGSVVTLSGTVATEEQKKAAEVAASHVDGVTQVRNSLTVQP